jgi:mono/diheme cytochrome c family protein
VTGQAPALNTVLSRFSPDQVNQIITYGRPGTPMQPWGVAGGGAKNEQSVDDLVAYLQSIQLSPAQARAQAAANTQKLIDSAIGNPAKNIKSDLETAQESLTTAQQQLAKDQALAQQFPNTKGIQINIQIDQEAVTNARAAIVNSTNWQRQVQTLVNTWKGGDATKAGPAQTAYGQLLFMTNCARCHTKGWSYFDPTKGEVPLPAQQGSGAFGPNLTNGDTVRQFPPGTDGLQQMYDWIATGVEANKQYGVRGISSGRMPHFGTILTKDQIEAIMAYERSL